MWSWYCIDGCGDRLLRIRHLRIGIYCDSWDLANKAAWGREVVWLNEVVMRKERVEFRNVKHLAVGGRKGCVNRYYSITRI